MKKSQQMKNEIGAILGNVTVETKNLLLGFLHRGGCDNVTGIVRIFSIILQDRPMLRHIIRKISAKAFN